MNSRLTRITMVVGGLVLAGVAVWLLIQAVGPLLFWHKEEVAAGPGARELKVVSVTRRVLSRMDQLPGEIHAYQDVAIYPKVPGFVKTIKVDRGSIVKEGDVMVEMFAPEYIARKNEAHAKVLAAQATLRESESRLESDKAKLLEARATLLGDESTYARLKAASLVPGVVASNDVIVLGQTVEADKERVAAWENKVKAAANEVSAHKDNVVAAKKAEDNFKDFASYLTLTAPFNGYITERNMHVGSFVGPLGSGAYPPIVRIQQLDLLRVVCPVPERDTHGVVEGAPVEFSVSTFPGRRFKGTVARLGNYLEQKTRTMPVELNYDNPDNKVLPGMFCEVYWPVRRQQSTLFVPSTAVASSTLQTFICRVKDGKVEWVPVRRGQMMGELVEIFGAVHEGDIVAQIGSDELRQGTVVKPVRLSQSQLP